MMSQLFKLFIKIYVLIYIQGGFIMKKKKLELYRDFLLLIRYYKENQNNYIMSKEDINKYLDNLTNDKFDLYQAKRNTNNKVKVLSLFK